MTDTMYGGFLRGSNQELVVVGKNGASIAAADYTGGIYVDAAPYSAVGDGTTDDTAAIQSAINAAGALSVDRQVVLGPKTYRIATGLVGADGVSIVGQGTDRTVLLLDDVLADGIGYNVGVSASAATLSADMAEHDQSITLTSGGSSFPAGTTCMVASSGASPEKGRWVGRVQTQVGNVITFEEPSPISLTTAGDGATLYKYSMMRNFRLSDFTIKTTGATPTTRKYLVRLERIEDVTVERLAMENARAASASALYMQVGRNVTVRHCQTRDILATATALPFQCDAITNLRVENNDIRWSSSGIIVYRSPRSVIRGNTISGSGSVSTGRGIKINGGSNYTACTGNVVDNFNSAGVYLSDSWGCAVTGNTISNIVGGNGINGTTDGGYGGQRNHHNSITGNTVRKVTGYGITHFPNAGTGDDCANVISDNDISLVTLGAIYIGTSGNVVRGNVCQSYGTSKNGIECQSGTANNLIDGNRCENGGSGNAVASSGGNQIGLNRFGTEARSVAGTDTMLYIDTGALKYRGSSATTTTLGAA